MEDQSTEEIINAAEFARRLGVDRSAITRYVRDGKLEPFSREYKGLKPQPKFRASDVERLRRTTREGTQSRTDIV